MSEKSSTLNSDFMDADFDNKVSLIVNKIIDCNKHYDYDSSHYKVFLVALCKTLFYKLGSKFNIMVYSEPLKNGNKCEPIGVVFYEFIKFGDINFSLYIFTGSGYWSMLAQIEYWGCTGKARRLTEQRMLSDSGNFLEIQSASGLGVIVSFYSN